MKESALTNSYIFINFLIIVFLLTINVNKYKCWCEKLRLSLLNNISRKQETN